MATTNEGPTAPPEDKRVRRSRDALMSAAVRLVSERGSTAISVMDLAEAADVTRKVLYMHFGDRDALIVAAAVDATEAALSVAGSEDPFERIVALAQHLADHRAFYRAVFSGPCAFAAGEAMNDLFTNLNRNTVTALFGDLDESTLADMTLFFAAGVRAVVHDWIRESETVTGPEVLASRLRRLSEHFAQTLSSPELSH